MWKRVIADYKTVNAIIEGMKLALGNGFVDPGITRESKGKVASLLVLNPNHRLTFRKTNILYPTFCMRTT